MDHLLHASGETFSTRIGLPAFKLLTSYTEATLPQADKEVILPRSSRTSVITRDPLRPDQVLEDISRALLRVLDLNHRQDGSTDRLRAVTVDHRCRL